MLNLDHLDFGSQEYKSFQINKRLQIFIYMLIFLFPFFSSFSPLFPLSFFSFSSPFFLGGRGARGPPGREARGTCPMCPMVNPSLAILAIPGRLHDDVLSDDASGRFLAMDQSNVQCCGQLYQSFRRHTHFHDQGLEWFSLDRELFFEFE